MEQRDANHETIFGKKPPKEQYIPPPLPPEEKEESKVEWISGDNNDAKR